MCRQPLDGCEAGERLLTEEASSARSCIHRGIQPEVGIGGGGDEGQAEGSVEGAMRVDTPR